MFFYILYFIFFLFFFFFFFNDTATTEIYTLSLHDTLPIWPRSPPSSASARCTSRGCCARRDRKSTRLNSSHITISYAVFCLKKKKHTKSELQNQTNKNLYHLINILSPQKNR